MDNSLLRRRLGRRAFLTGAGGMAAAAATLALGACGEGGDSESGGTAPGAAANPQSAAQPRRGGTLRINQTGDISLNAGYPFVVSPQNSRLPWTVSETLVRYRKEITQPELVLADRFEYNADRTRLLVSINRDGSLHEVLVLESSGQPLLDQAAQRIVRLAAPFAPFTGDLADIDRLEIIRTWKFAEGDRLSSN